MKAQLLIAAIITASSGAVLAQSPSQDIARGNMPVQMDVNVMDSNHDGMVSKQEWSAYGEKIWKAISHGKATVPVDSAATDFATGHMSMNTQEMDANHDGVITHDEFIAYGSKAFDKVKDAKGMMSTSDVTKNFATGNMKQ